MAEAILRHLAGDRLEVLSAGTDARESVHPDAIATLSKHRIDTGVLAPKDVATFAGEAFDHVITVCDRAREQCPAFPGAAMIHWSFPDPTAVADPRVRVAAFEEVFFGLTQRLRLLVTVLDGRDAPRPDRR